MKPLSVEVTINAPKEKVWNVITNIEHAADFISGIEKVEVLDRPQGGFTGFKWRETRTMFGKTATEVMWVTDSVENKSYTTRAESHGAIYTTKMDIAEQDGNSVLRMEFGAEIQSFVAKVMWTLTGFMFKSSTRKALQQDLEDIKKAVEQS